MISPYYDKEFVKQALARGDHRSVVGGLWAELGMLQLNFLRSKGMLPHHRLLDIGCGSLRLGVCAAAYLEAGNYWGTDLHAALLSVGYDRELVPAGLDTRVARSNLVTDKDFCFIGVPQKLDFAIAQSVFTHLPSSWLRLCLANLASHVQGPLQFYATFFIVPEGLADGTFEQQPGAVVTQRHSDPYHYALSDIRLAAVGLPWKIELIGDWQHPRGQQMVCFCKTDALL